LGGDESLTSLLDWVEAFHYQEMDLRGAVTGPSYKGAESTRGSTAKLSFDLKKKILGDDTHRLWEYFGTSGPVNETDRGSVV